MRRRRELIVLAALALCTALVVSAGTPEMSRLARQVRHELVMLPQYGVFDNFQFRIDGSKVTLLGEVVRPTLKSSAERVVQRIEGVTEVVNEIETLPVSGHDDDIRIMTYRALYGHPALDRYGYRAVPPIHIIVKNGDVTLEGVVNNKAEKLLANAQARSVPGVFSVTNNLRLDEESEE